MLKNKAGHVVAVPFLKEPQRTRVLSQLTEHKIPTAPYPKGMFSIEQRAKFKE